MNRLAMASAVLFILANCGRRVVHDEHWENERARVNLTQKLNLAEYQLSLTGKNRSAELGIMAENLRKLEKRTQFLNQRRSILTDELSELERLTTEAKRTARETRRAASVGRSFQELVLNDGRTLRNGTITDIDDAGVSLRHAHGSARIRLQQLTSEQREFFGLEQQSALVALAREKRDRHAYEHWIQEELATLRKNDEKYSALAAHEEHQRTDIFSAPPPPPIQSLSPLMRPATRLSGGSRANRYRHFSRVRFYRPTTYRVIHHLPAQADPCRVVRPKRMSAQPFRAVTPRTFPRKRSFSSPCQSP